MSYKLTFSKCNQVQLSKSKYFYRLAHVLSTLKRSKERRGRKVLKSHQLGSRKPSGHYKNYLRPFKGVPKTRQKNFIRVYITCHSIYLIKDELAWKSYLEYSFILYASMCKDKKNKQHKHCKHFY